MTEITIDLKESTLSDEKWLWRIRTISIRNLAKCAATGKGTSIGER